jgi:hypothetical protein
VLRPWLCRLICCRGPLIHEHPGLRSLHVADFERVDSEPGSTNRVVRLAVKKTASAANPFPARRQPMLPTATRLCCDESLFDKTAARQKGSTRTPTEHMLYLPVEKFGQRGVPEKVMTVTGEAGHVTESMIQRVGKAIARADAGDFDAEPSRYLRFAKAALEPMKDPTDDMVNAAKQVISMTSRWSIKSDDDFKKAVAAMIRAALLNG